MSAVGFASAISRIVGSIASAADSFVDAPYDKTSNADLSLADASLDVDESGRVGASVEEDTCDGAGVDANDADCGDAGLAVEEANCDGADASTDEADDGGAGMAARA